MDNIWDEVIRLSLKSLDTEDVPIGAVIVRDGSIISSAFNTREKEQNILGHAEINAILGASKKINNWNLSDCDLYVSLKPCSMCMEIIKQSRIRNVFYLLDKPTSKKEFYKTNFIQDKTYKNKEKYANILSDFFKKLREKSK